MSINSYVKKPVVISAIQWNGNNTEEIKNFCNNLIVKDNYLIIQTLEGQHIADKNDFIIRGIKGEFYPCKPDVFEKTYELIS